MDVRNAIVSMFRVLGFRAKREELESNALPMIIVALAATWLVGLGRWWDDPRDLQWYVRSGLGSVIYVIGLSALLWLVVLPISRQRLGISVFLAFVASTSLPGIVYSVPIERWTDTATAAQYNLYALLFVSTYRVALLIWFLRKIVNLSVPGVFAATFLPISLIVLTLTMLGHGAAVMDIMGGFRGERTAKADMEIAVGTLGCLAWLIGPFSLLIYLAEVVMVQVAINRDSKSGED